MHTLRNLTKKLRGPGGGLDNAQNAQIKALEEDLKKLTALLEAFLRAIKGFSDAATVMARSSTDLADQLGKVAAKENERAPGAHNGPALQNLSKIQRQISASTEAVSMQATVKLASYMQMLLKTDLKSNVLVQKQTYDKALEALQQASNKLADVKSKKNLDLVKIVNAEKEVARAKASFQDAFDQLYATIVSALDRIDFELLETLQEFETSQRTALQDIAIAHSDMIGFYKEVQSSCDKAKTAFEAHVQSRSGALNNTIQKYYEERYRSFVEFVCDLTFISALGSLVAELPQVGHVIGQVQRIGLSYGKPLPTEVVGRIMDPGTNLVDVGREAVDKHDVPAVRDFIKQHLLKVTTALCQMNQRDKAVTLCAILGQISTSGGWDLRT
jgi:tetratricopeptide (TPR) repeat protein